MQSVYTSQHGHPRAIRRMGGRWAALESLIYNTILVLVLRPLSRYHAPWDWKWPLSGEPRQIADDFHAVVSRAVFGVSLLDFVKCALRYNNQALSIDTLLNTTCNARNSLQKAIQGLPQTKDTYVEVEKVSYNHR